MRELTIKLHAVAEDGLPDMEQLTGRVAFIWDGNLISGWPSERHGGGVWEPAEDRFGEGVLGVTHWVELPEPVWNMPQQETQSSEALTSHQLAAALLRVPDLPVIFETEQMEEGIGEVCTYREDCILIGPVPGARR